MDKKKIHYIIIFSALLPFISSVFYFVVFSGTLFAKLLYTLTKIFTLLAPIIFYKFGLKPKFKFNLKFDKRSLILGISSGLAINLAIFLLFKFGLHDLVRGAAPAITEKVKQFGVYDYYLQFGAFISILHSLIEEYFWRWYLFGALALIYPFRTAALLSSIAFSLHHIVVAEQYFGLSWGIPLGLCVGIGGYIWSILLAKTESLTASWISHMLVDIYLLWIGYFVIYN